LLGFVKNLILEGGNYAQKEDVRGGETPPVIIFHW